ncbi:MAG: EamA family transporter, partial [Calditrichaeota bacterium]|nr:EamA family transporter [Calditrichota bacterium]
MKPSLKDILLLFLLGSMWGPSFMFIKISVHEIPPITLVAIRVSSAALILYTILRLNGRRLPGGKIWIRFAIMAFFASAFPFLLFAWGQQYIDSAMAGIINGSSPLVTVFLAHFFLDNDRLTWRKLIGILTGFSGLVALIGPSALEGMSFNTLGLIAAFVASGSYGVSFVYSRKYLIGLPRLVAPTAQFIMSGLMLIPVAFLIESPQTLPLPSTKVIVSMSALIIMGTAMAQVLYFYLVE